MFRWIGSKRQSKQSKRSKQKGKQNHPQSTRGRAKEGRRFTQTTQKERDHMFELRSKGYSVHAIAKQLSRSSRTVHQTLTEKGTQPLPDPDEQIADPWAEERKERGCYKRSRRKRRGEKSTRVMPSSSASSWRSLDPMLEQMAKDLINTNEDFALHVLAAQLGIKMPVITVDDMIQGDIRRDPELRSRLAEDKVNRLIRRGRTEMEIAEEYFGLATKLAEWKETGRWAEVVEKAVTSGELRKTVEAFIGITSTNRQPSSGKTLPPHSINQGENTPEPQMSELDTADLELGSAVASLSSKTPTSMEDSAVGPNASARPNGPRRKRHKLSQLSPEERERKLRIIRQPISITLDQPKV